MSADSSTTHYRRYLWGALSLPVGMLGIWLVAGIYMEPFEGDLTRIGGFFERDYGPSQAFDTYAPPAFSTGRYAAPVDVLIIGDSFSMDERHGWPNGLVEATGLTAHAVHVNDVTWRDIEKSEVFRSTPPRMVLFELVERQLNLLPRFLGGDWRCDADTATSGLASPPIPLVPPVRLVPQKRATQRASRSQSWGDVDVTLAGSALMRSGLRTLFGLNFTKARRFALTHDRYFSNRKAANLLVYLTDLNKPRYQNDAFIQQLACAAATLRQRLGAGGIPFAVVIAPDKLTAYADSLVDRDVAAISRLDEIMGQIGPETAPRVDKAVFRAIDQGEKDVYLPNDTHWSARGHAIAADAIVKGLLARGDFVFEAPPDGP